MKDGSKAGTYLASSSGVSRSGSTVTKSTCTRSPSLPSFSFTAFISTSVVGHTSGQCVKPKNTTTTLPLKSASVRGRPVWSVSWSSRPKSAPVTSTLLNDGLPGSQAATSAAASSATNLQIVIDQQRGEEHREVDDRVTEGPPREGVAVVDIDAHRVGDEEGAEQDRRGEIEPAAHPVDERHDAGGGEDQRVEQHVQLGELAPVRDRQHRQSGARVLLGAVERERPEVRRRPREDDQEQEQRFRRHLSGYRRPAEHRRHRARRAADHDVLRGERLEH